MARRRLSRHRHNRILIWLLAGMVAIGVYQRTGAILATAAGWGVLRITRWLPWL